MKPWTRWLILAAAIAAAGGPVAAAPPGLRSNDRTMADVRMKLTSDPVVKGVPIRVQVVNGFVILEGCVASANVSQHAEQAARKSPGVRAVNNNLFVGHC